MTTVDHKARHIWATTPGGIRCAYMFCNARPEPAEVAKLEAEERQRRAMHRGIRFGHSPRA